jgi:hypothetical protein
MVVPGHGLSVCAPTRCLGAKLGSCEFAKCSVGDPSFHDPAGVIFETGPSLAYSRIWSTITVAAVFPYTEPPSLPNMLPPEFIPLIALKMLEPLAVIAGHRRKLGYRTPGTLEKISNLANSGMPLMSGAPA